MGCCSPCFAEDDTPRRVAQRTNMMPSEPCIIIRDKKHIYEVTFPRRPLYITITSSKNNNGGYITAFDRLCPVEDAKENIVLQSKVIFVNGILVEGCNVSVIANRLKEATMPITLTLVHPDGLGHNEVPDMKPGTILQLQDNPRSAG